MAQPSNQFSVGRLRQVGLNGKGNDTVTSRLAQFWPLALPFEPRLKIRNPEGTPI
ncbi:unnamed protein product [Periconia digitata]|uniref:Uncharacterized protein n=1 Tax=Periconia digitata TaxID=1303443 RepID=A0A9W4XGU6_9PLEO|nr:unnamed protein product [Periconia digitata]